MNGKGKEEKRIDGKTEFIQLFALPFIEKNYTVPPHSRSRAEMK